MGIGGISVWQLIILLVIVVLVFGTKRLRNMGSDLGAAIKGFRKGMDDEKEGKDDSGEPEQLGGDATPSPQTTSEADAEFREKEQGHNKKSQSS